MDAYIYQSALLCDDCAHDRQKDNWSQRRNDDSNVYPKGPYGDGGGEADHPQHCADCNLFLENPLTTDGEDYVRDAVDSVGCNTDTLTAWREHYAYLFQVPEPTFAERCDELAVSWINGNRSDVRAAILASQGETQPGHETGMAVALALGVHIALEGMTAAGEYQTDFAASMLNHLGFAAFE